MPPNKIKKFRLSPRPSYIIKNFRALIATDQEVTQEVEDTINAEAAACQDMLSTAAMYETLGKNEFPDWLKDYCAQTGIKKFMAASLLASTIGSGIEKEIAAIAGQGDDLRAKILTALAREFCDQSVLFILRLINDEAKHEGRIVLEHTLPADSTTVQNILLALGAEKIGIEFAGEGLAPKFSLASIVFWLPASAKKT